MHWAVYRHHPQGGLADHHCLFERAGLITQPECHWGGLISQLALVYFIFTKISFLPTTITTGTYYHFSQLLLAHIIISTTIIMYYHYTQKLLFAHILSSTTYTIYHPQLWNTLTFTARVSWLYFQVIVYRSIGTHAWN